MEFTVEETYSKFHEKNVFIARYKTETCRGYNVGETRREAVVNAAGSFLDDDEDILDLLRAVYDAGVKEKEVEKVE